MSFSSSNSQGKNFHNNKEVAFNLLISQWEIIPQQPHQLLVKEVQEMEMVDLIIC